MSNMRTLNVLQPQKTCGLDAAQRRKQATYDFRSEWNERAMHSIWNHFSISAQTRKHPMRILIRCWLMISYKTTSKGVIVTLHAGVSFGAHTHCTLTPTTIFCSCHSFTDYLNDTRWPCKWSSVSLLCLSQPPYLQIQIVYFRIFCSRTRACAHQTDQQWSDHSESRRQVTRSAKATHQRVKKQRF